MTGSSLAMGLSFTTGEPKARKGRKENWIGAVPRIPNSKFQILNSLRTPSSARHRLETDSPSDRRRDDSELGHQAIELRGVHGLRAVAQRVIGIAMHFDDQAVGAGGHRGARHR